MIKFNPKIDYYKVLGVDQKFSDEELKSAYRKKALATHPDINPNKDSDAFREVGEAYDVLSDPDSRVQYDIERGTTQSFSEIFGSIFREAQTEVKAEFYQGQRAAFEANLREQQERTEREAREKAKEKVRLNKLWREGMERVIPYFVRFPNLREEFLNDKDWFRDNFAYEFGRDGTLFYKDLEIFSSLLNSKKTVTGEEIYKLALETRDSTVLKGKIPLKTESISGLELLVTITAPIKKPYTETKYEDFSFSSAQIGFNYSNVPYCRDDFLARTPLPIDYHNPRDSLMRVGNFIAHLNRQVREGNYAINLSEEVPTGHSLYKSVKTNHALSAHGFWIRSLSLGDDEVIRDGEVVNLPTGLSLLD